MDACNVLVTKTGVVCADTPELRKLPGVKPMQRDLKGNLSPRNVEEAVVVKSPPKKASKKSK